MLVRYFGTIIRITIMAMHRSGHDNFSCCTVDWKLVRYNQSSRSALAFHQFSEKAYCRLFVLALLYQNIEDIAVLIYSAPQVSPIAPDRHNINFIQVPGIAERASTFLDRSCICWTEFTTPMADGFVRNNYSTLGQ